MSSPRFLGSVFGLVAAVFMAFAPLTMLAIPAPAAPAGLVAGGGANNGLCAPGQIYLLEPINGNHCLDPNAKNPVQTFFDYANPIFNWTLGVSAGVCILWGIYGGVRMMISAGDQSAYAEHRGHLVHALIGLLLILFAATILNFLNPTFYTPR